MLPITPPKILASIYQHPILLLFYIHLPLIKSFEKKNLGKKKGRLHPTPTQLILFQLFVVWPLFGILNFLGILMDSPPVWVRPSCLSWSLCASLAWRLSRRCLHIYIYIHMMLHIIMYIYMIWYMFLLMNIILIPFCYEFALVFFMNWFRTSKTALVSPPGLRFHLHLERILLFTPHRLWTWSTTCRYTIYHIYAFLNIYILTTSNNDYILR